tara:strand:+ start:193 stop:543 length:351 start_codon:yes stop_codon:yes gene_type:complete
MSNTRDLQENINDLKALLLSAEQDANKLKAKIQETDEEINNLNKPVINGVIVQEIRDAIEIAIGNYNFDDSDNYEYDFEIDYHSQINISNIEFERKDELADCLSELIENVFNVIPD